MIAFVQLFVALLSGLGCSDRVADAHDGLYTVAELEGRALAYRRDNFRKGHVVLHMLERAEGRDDVEFEYEITFDAGRLRFDWRGRRARSKYWGQPTKVIIDGEKYISDARRDLTVLVAPTNEYDDVRDNFDAFHPRALGMSVSGTVRLGRYGMGAHLNRNDRANVRMVAEERDTQQLWRIDYDTVEGAHTSVWVSPRQGYAVVRVQVEDPPSQGDYVHSVSSTMMQYPPLAIWYPSKVYTRVVFEGRVVNETFTTVTEAAFGTNVDDQVFTLAGLGLAADRRIVDRFDGPPTQFFWDAKSGKAVTRKAIEVQRFAREVARNGSLRRRGWLWGLNAIFLAVVACIFVIRLFRARSRR